MTVACLLCRFLCRKDSHPCYNLEHIPTEVDESLKRRKQWRSLKPKVLDARAPDFNTDTLAGFIQRSEPVIVKHLEEIGVDFESSLAPLSKNRKRQDESASAFLHIELSMWPFATVGKSLSNFIYDYCGRRAILFVARFSGGYKAGLAHIDSSPSYNFYYVVKGKKQVYLVPRQFNPSRVGVVEPDKLQFLPGLDNVHIAGDTTDAESLKDWLPNIPAVWDFQVEAGDVLLFNNAATCHKFINLTPNPEIFTIRVQNFTGASHLSLRNDMFNWAGAKSFAALILSRATVRDPGHYKR